MGFVSFVIVLLSVLAIDAASVQEKSESVTYWHEKLPMTAIPESLMDLISDEDEKVAVNVGKGGVNVAVGKPPRKAAAPKPQPKPTPNPQPKPTAKGKGVGVSVKPPAKGGGGGGVSVGTPGKGVGVHVGTKSPYDYNYAADAEMLADPSLSMFLLEKDLHSGTKVSLQLVQKSISEKTHFLPRSVADQIPFSSNKISAALKQLNIEENSDTAVDMKVTLQECETRAIKGESKYCATSLESMIDYTRTRLGTNLVSVLITNVPKTPKSIKQQYTITDLPYQSKPEAKSVVCHSQRYAYAVYYCHESKDTRTVQVSLKGDDGSTAEAVAVCHADTSAWNPSHLAFQVLDVKPGGAAVCHFIPQNHIVWLPAN